MSNFEDDPFRSPMPTQQPGYRPPAGQANTGLIIAVAIINYVFGGLQVGCGACLAIFGATFTQMMGGLIEQDRSMTPEDQAALGIMTAVFIGMGVVFALCGLPTVLAGYGVQCQKEWGRILTIVLAGISALMAVMFLLGLNPLGLFFAGYSIFTLIVLLNSDNARAFK
ncbi:hypothetical protein C5Y96_04915 [Blastopirellula marina]|uniref:Uncharacterized protein n=1 Tax=Blastopirellula marina TaxID=124 RepID=A0A2S8G4K9_9BACT|nr:MULTISPECIES: hypothetical protein [Pirellulaceae]PQO39201.1 hypothetical protein C5Y96_04915 [Blastopirellula marina]RCS55509.1 hypothetical protein DTL36_04925 [Bremerella cremea]